MKKSIIFTICTCAIALLLTSCGSVPTEEKISKKDDIKSEITAPDKSVTEETTTDVTTETTTEESEEVTKETEEEVTETVHSEDDVILLLDDEVEVDENFEFITSLDNVNLSIPNTPTVWSIRNEFNMPFTITAMDNAGNPLANYPITIKYPSSRVDGEIVYATENLFTNEKGVATYTAKAPEFSCLDVFAAYPTPINEDPEVLEACKISKVTTPWKVRSEIINRNQMLFVWNYTINGNPQKESTELQMALKAAKISVGNAPFSGDSSYLNGSAKQVWQDHYDLVGDDFGYLIFGTIKYEEAPELSESGEFECELIADIQAIKMRDGSVPFHKTFKQRGKGANWNYCDADAKKGISEQITNALLYEL